MGKKHSKMFAVGILFLLPSAAFAITDDEAAKSMEHKTVIDDSGRIGQALDSYEGANLCVKFPGGAHPECGDIHKFHQEVFPANSENIRKGHDAIVQGPVMATSADPKNPNIKVTRAEPRPVVASIDHVYDNGVVAVTYLAGAAKGKTVLVPATEIDPETNELQGFHNKRRAITLDSKETGTVVHVFASGKVTMIHDKEGPRTEYFGDISMLSKETDTYDKFSLRSPKIENTNLQQPGRICQIFENGWMNVAYDGVNRANCSTSHLEFVENPAILARANGVEEHIEQKVSAQVTGQMAAPSETTPPPSQIKPEEVAAVRKEIQSSDYGAYFPWKFHKDNETGDKPPVTRKKQKKHKSATPKTAAPAVSIPADPLNSSPAKSAGPAGP